MAATELSAPAPARSHRRWASLLCCYALVWVGTLLGAGIVALAGTAGRATSRHLLGLALTPTRPPSFGNVLALAAHNLPLAAWPLLLGLLEAERSRLTRRLADSLVAACILANTVPVGAAYAAYGPRVLAYVPQLPLEWAALALGLASWAAQRRAALGNTARLAWLAAIAVTVLAAAVLETFAVPYR